MIHLYSIYLRTNNPNTPEIGMVESLSPSDAKQEFLMYLKDISKNEKVQGLTVNIKEQVPGLFDCRIEVVGKDSVVKIIEAKMVNAKVKTS